VQGCTPRKNLSSHGGWDSVNGPVSPRRDILRDWTRTMSHRSRDVSRDKQYTAPNEIPNEQYYIDIFESGEPRNKQEISEPFARTPAINRPTAGGYSAVSNSKGGSSRGGAADQLLDYASSSNQNDETESDDEDEEDPLAVIEKSKKSPFSPENAHLGGNLGKV